MRIIIMHETVADRDTVGDDIERMYGILSELYDCKVFAINQFNENVEYISRDELERLLDDPELVVIYHHSANWEYGFQMLRKVKGRIIIRCHSITPPSFYERYNDWHYSQCVKGRELTERMQGELPDAYWVCDSPFNASELKAVSPDRIGVCPPFNTIDLWGRTRPDEGILKELLESRTVNLLFVGRVAPDKGHRMMLDVLLTYCACYDAEITLKVIGSFDQSIPGYNDFVLSTVKKRGLDGNIEFIESVDDSALMAYYLGSDAFLCCSEHEGFCMPIVEAQYFGLPIVALDAGAVPETLGVDQLCFDADTRLFAAAIRRIVEVGEYRQYLREAGWKNYREHFSFAKTREMFLKEFEKGLKA